MTLKGRWSGYYNQSRAIFFIGIVLGIWIAAPIVLVVFRVVFCKRSISIIIRKKEDGVVLFSVM